MNDYIAELTLDLNCERSCQTVMLTQYDTGKKLRLTVTADGAPYSVAGCEVLLKGVNPDGGGFAIDCAVMQDGAAIAVTDDITHAVKGIAAARFAISDSTRTYHTQRFLIFVDDALESDYPADPRYSALEELIRRVQLIDEHGGIIVDDEVNAASTHPVENRAVAAALNSKLDDANGVIHTNHLGYYAVTTDKLLPAAVTNEKLSINAVDTANLRSRVVTLGKLAQEVIDLIDGKADAADTADAITDIRTDIVALENGLAAANTAISGKADAADTADAITDIQTDIIALENGLAAANTAISGKADAADTADAITDILTDIIALENGQLATDSAVEDVKAYIGYTASDIVGLQADFENKRFTRLAGAVGKSAGTDFDGFAMYGGRRRCAVAADGSIVSFCGDADYSDYAEDTDYDIMVYQPRFYYKVVPLKLEKQTGNGMGYHIRKANYYISATPHAGFRLHPLFFDANGNELEYVLLGAYEASYWYNRQVSTHGIIPTCFHDGEDSSTTIASDDVLKSVANVKPISGLYKNLTRAATETLAQNKSNDGGWHALSIKAVAATQLLFLLEYATPNAQTALGSGVTAIQGDSTHNCASLTGSTAALGNGSGSASATTNEIGGTETVYQTTGKLAVSYRGMENLWGNLNELPQGINIYGDGAMNGGQPYLADGFTYDDYAAGGYHGAGFSLPNANGWISALGYGGEAYDWLLLPSEKGGNSALPVGDNQYVAANNSAQRMVVTGGSWGTDTLAGLFYAECSLSSRALPSVSYMRRCGCRLMYIPTARGGA